MCSATIAKQYVARPRIRTAQAESVVSNLLPVVVAVVIVHKTFWQSLLLLWSLTVMTSTI